MRFFLLWLLLMAGGAEVARAQEPSSSPTASPTGSPLPTASSTPAKTIAATLSREIAGESTTIFATDTPGILMRWQSESVVEGDRVRCVWIAEDVGQAAPRDYHVDETVTTAKETPAFGSFSLSRPKKGWPPGKYRAELYLNSDLVTTLPFIIEAPRGD